jgi:hypothetical protein
MFAIMQVSQPDHTSYDIVEGNLLQLGHTRSIIRFSPAKGGAVFRPLGGVAYATEDAAWAKLESLLDSKIEETQKQLDHLRSLRFGAEADKAPAAPQPSQDEEYYIEVVSYADDAVSKRLGPANWRRAEKIESGLEINLNHDLYYTRVIPVSEAGPA